MEEFFAPLAGVIVRTPDPLKLRLTISLIEFNPSEYAGSQISVPTLSGWQSSEDGSCLELKN